MSPADALAVVAVSGSGDRWLLLFFHFGVYGLFLISAVDSSFVPLPLPGATDVLCVVLAAQHTNLFLLLVLSTAGSAVGGFLSYQVGQRGGMAFLEKKVPRRILRRVTRWMERHAVLAVALPAILPPPMPLSPFVLAAGALKMSRRTFMTTFTISRALRHLFAIWLGIHYGSHVLGFWARFSERWATTILAILWSLILGSLAYTAYRLYTTTREVGGAAKVPSSS
jgi:membrane protein YqaA with SNARE-associated domain